MKIEKIAYEQLYPTGTFANQRYRVEILIEEDDCKLVGQGEAIKNAFVLAKEQVEKTFIALNPQINWSEKDTWLAPRQEAHIITSQPTDKPRDTVDNIIEDINSCKDLKTVDSYRLIAKTNERILEAYENKLGKLMSQAKKDTTNDNT